MTGRPTATANRSSAVHSESDPSYTEASIPATTYAANAGRVAAMPPPP